MGVEFPQFMGNTRAVRVLTGAIARGELAHAYLLTGPAGSGKKTLARAAAGRIFCPDGCNRCSDCRLLAKGTHPDFRIFSSSGRVKLEMAKALKHFLYLPPANAGKKVAVLENCHRMTTEAANSLLNVLEEPPPASICFLTAEKASEVLPTIVSRAQVLALQSLPLALVREHLEQQGANSFRTETIAAYSGGVLGRALALNDDEDFFTRREQWAKTVLALLVGKADPLQVSAQWYSDGEALLEFMVYWYRDLLMLQTVPGYRPVNSDLEKQVAAALKHCPAERAIEILQSCALARQRLLANCNPRLVFDSLFLRMWK